MLEIAGKKFDSHLIMGTGGATSQTLLEKALVASGTQLTTVAMRRFRAGNNAGTAGAPSGAAGGESVFGLLDRKRTRLNSSHVSISYAVFCLKKKRLKLLI